MKRLSLLSFVGLLASASASALMTGCPIFDGGNGSGYYPGNQSTGGCVGLGCGAGGSPGSCSKPGDCPTDETCGPDNQCHSGDCTFSGCLAGYTCTVGANNQATCTPDGAGGSAGSAGAAGGTTTGVGGHAGAGTGGHAGSGTGGHAGAGGAGGAGGAPVVYCGHPGDCAASQTCGASGTCEPGSCSPAEPCIYGYTCSAGASATCQPANPSSCGVDADCAAKGAGYACVNGLCTAPAQQCFDQSQCPASNNCVDGKCVATCTKNTDCPAAFDCNVPLGVCSTPAQPCTITNDCGGPNLVCVGGGCVNRSPMGTCPVGQSWVENGCVPTTPQPSFECLMDGQAGVGAGTPGSVCASGSICLHNFCFISCAAPNPTVCAALPDLNVCETVSESGSSYQVCGTSQVGSECSPTKACPANKICVDGNCK